jgi:hypothetical protein
MIDGDDPSNQSNTVTGFIGSGSGVFSNPVGVSH